MTIVLACRLLLIACFQRKRGLQRSPMSCWLLCHRPLSQLLALVLRLNIEASQLVNTLRSEGTGQSEDLFRLRTALDRSEGQLK